MFKYKNMTRQGDLKHDYGFKIKLHFVAISFTRSDNNFIQCYRRSGGEYMFTSSLIVCSKNLGIMDALKLFMHGLSPKNYVYYK